MSDPIKTKAERYGSAAVAGQLRFREERPTDLDTLTAAGMTGLHEPTGITIWRAKYANDRHSYRQALDLLQGKVRNQARRKHWREPAGQLRLLAVAVFRWWVFGVCPVCQGRGHPLVEGTDRVLSDDPCPACYGDGHTMIEHAVPVPLIGRAKDIAQLLEVAERRTHGLMREKLSRRDLPAKPAPVQSGHAATTCPGENRATTTTGAAATDGGARPDETGRAIAALLRSSATSSVTETD